MEYKQIYLKKQKKILRKDTVWISEAVGGRCSVKTKKLIKIDIK